MFLPFNRAPLAPFNHEGDIETVQIAVAIPEQGAPHVLEVVMGKHGRRILALPNAMEWERQSPAGLHARIWLDEGSHEPYPFRGRYGMFTSEQGIFYTSSAGNLLGLREMMLSDDADPTDANALAESWKSSVR